MSDRNLIENPPVLNPQHNRIPIKNPIRLFLYNVPSWGVVIIRALLSEACLGPLTSGNYHIDTESIDQVPTVLHITTMEIQV